MGMLLALTALGLVMTGACISTSEREVGFLLLCIGVILAFVAALAWPRRQGREIERRITYIAPASMRASRMRGRGRRSR